MPTRWVRSRERSLGLSTAGSLPRVYALNLGLNCVVAQLWRRCLTEGGSDAAVTTGFGGCGTQSTILSKWCWCGLLPGNAWMRDSLLCRSFQFLRCFVDHRRVLIGVMFLLRAPQFALAALAARLKWAIGARGFALHRGRL